MTHRRGRWITAGLLLAAGVALHPPAASAQTIVRAQGPAPVPANQANPPAPIQIPAAPVQPTPRAPVQAPAPTVMQLSLDEARQMALANNRSLALARLNVESKGHAASAASKDYLPKLIGNETYFHFNDNLGSVVTVQKGKLGILPPGALTSDVSVVNKDSSLTTLMLAQPLTKLIAVHALTQIARADEASARAQLDKGTRDLLSGVAQAYHGLVGLRRLQAALELQIQILEQAAAAKPIPELRVSLLQARQGLIEVRGQVRELNDQLASLLALPPCTILDPVDPLPVDLTVHSPDDAAQLAMTNSPEVREAQQTVCKAEAALKIARMAYLPDVSVVGGYANQTTANYIQPDIGYVGVTGSWTMFEWGKKRDVTRQRETDIAMAQENVRVTMDKVGLEARKAFSTFEQTREAYQLAGEMVQARKDAEKNAAGAAMLQAKGDTAKAELEAMKAEIAYRVAHAQLAGLICP